MLKILAAGLFLVVANIPAATAFAEGNGGDRAPYVLPEANQEQPTDQGTVAGSDAAPTGPFYQLRVENMGR
jgi:hypothetical protein